MGKVRRTAERKELCDCPNCAAYRMHLATQCERKAKLVAALSARKRGKAPPRRLPFQNAPSTYRLQ